MRKLVVAAILAVVLSVTGVAIGNNPSSAALPPLQCAGSIFSPNYPTCLWRWQVCGPYVYNRWVDLWWDKCGYAIM